MTSPKKRPRPPKCWAAHPVSKSRVPRASGTAHDGSIVVHPDEFKRLVDLGVIDHKGRRIDPPVSS